MNKKVLDYNKLLYKHACTSQIKMVLSLDKKISHIYIKDRRDMSYI